MRIYGTLKANHQVNAVDRDEIVQLYGSLWNQLFVNTDYSIREDRFRFATPLYKFSL